MKKYTWSLVFVVLLGFWACDDIIVPDISDDTIVLLAPGDSSKTSLNTITFWWEEMEGADSYNLQIVKPNFDFIEQLVVDTPVVDNQFTITLLPGQYGWRVRGINSAYETAFTTRAFEIDSSLNLSFQMVNLQLPLADQITNQNSIQFSWASLFNADEYQLVIEETPSGIEVSNIISSNNSSSFSFAADGNYTWKVKALNNISETVFSVRNITIDTQPPQAPMLLSPNDEDSLDVDDTITWLQDSNDLTELSNTVFIFNDMEGTDLVLSESVSSESFTITDELSTGQTYYWEVQSVDAAGNESELSELRAFYLNN